MLTWENHSVGMQSALGMLRRQPGSRAFPSLPILVPYLTRCSLVNNHFSLNYWWAEDSTSVRRILRQQWENRLNRPSSLFRSCCVTNKSGCVFWNWAIPVQRHTIFACRKAEKSRERGVLEATCFVHLCSEVHDTVLRAFHSLS